MPRFRQISIVVPTIIALGLVSPEARPDAFENLARDICFKVHGADARSIKTFEQSVLFRALAELQADTEQKRAAADRKEEEYKLELNKVEDIKLEIGKLENFQRYNRIFRVYANPINEKSLEAAELESAYDEQEDATKKQELRRQINQLDSEIKKLATKLSDVLPSGFYKEMRTRLGETGKFETLPDTGSYSRAMMWAVIPEVTLKLESIVQSELSKFNAALPTAEQSTAPFRQSFVEALVELKESLSMLRVMERAIKATEGCRDDAKSATPRRDIVANFKVSCTTPEFDYPICGHGSMWINFNEQGLATGESGLGRFCASNTRKQECLDVPVAQVSGTTGQIAGDRLHATVTYMLPSSRPRKDTGEFRFEGQVAPDGNVMPVVWRGSGSLTSIENKFPLPPDKPYVITCSGHWDTETSPACWDN